ncbi:unnamed protein product [Arabidopsis arenosa]|uniref:Uncharacterized protein n=1 Tax=Arabidopsis arenosa TaxID=38785 RepID=A0A8S1ZJA0_ARAAE|nr:unnamed protein product [Arabidopsis arenosa]
MYKHKDSDGSVTREFADGLEEFMITANQMPLTQETEGEVTHPSDAKAWQHFNTVHSDFARESRNVYLGLCTDGFSPFGMSGRQYSLWPVIVTPYNLPPDMCMQQEFLFLSILVGGHGPSRHTSGQKTYARRALESAEKNGGVLPPIVEIMEQTHKRKNGVFVDGFAEQICKEVSAKIAERESQLSPGHSDQPGGLSIAEKNNILLEAAPKNKKGRIYGVGSIQVIPSASSFDPPPTSDDYVDRQTYEAERKRNNDLLTRIHGYDYLFDIVAQDFPALATALRAQRPPTQGAEAQTEEPQHQTEEAATAQGTPQA